MRKLLIKIFTIGIIATLLYLVPGNLIININNLRITVSLWMALLMVLGMILLIYVCVISIKNIGYFTTIFKRRYKEKYLLRLHTALINGSTTSRHYPLVDLPRKDFLCSIYSILYSVDTNDGIQLASKIRTLCINAPYLAEDALKLYIGILVRFHNIHQAEEKIMSLSASGQRKLLTMYGSALAVSGMSISFFLHMLTQYPGSVPDMNENQINTLFRATQNQEVCLHLHATIIRKHKIPAFKALATRAMLKIFYQHTQGSAIFFEFAQSYIHAYTLDILTAICIDAHMLNGKFFNTLYDTMKNSDQSQSGVMLMALRLAIYINDCNTADICFKYISKNKTLITLSTRALYMSLQTQKVLAASIQEADRALNKTICTL